MSTIQPHDSQEERGHRTGTQRRLGTTDEDVERTVDSNIYISALMFGGKPLQLLEMALDGDVELAISEAILTETLRVLRDKFHRTPDQLQEAELLGSWDR